MLRLEQLEQRLKNKKTQVKQQSKVAYTVLWPQLGVSLHHCIRVVGLLFAEQSSTWYAAVCNRKQETSGSAEDQEAFQDKAKTEITKEGPTSRSNSSVSVNL